MTWQKLLGLPTGRWRNSRRSSKYNGFRVETSAASYWRRRHVSARQRSRPEYIPSDEEISRILNEAGLNLKWRAFFLALYTTGLRNTTLRALRYGDVQEELEAHTAPLLVRVYPEMKDPFFYVFD